jgi:hypothetical protein
MKVNYGEPYWVKFKWDLSNHHNNQYVTEFNKLDCEEISNITQNESFIITCQFKIEKKYKTDRICMIFGKPGNNLGLTYNTETNKLSFEFKSNDNHNIMTFDSITQSDIEKGILISIVKSNNHFIIYKNFEKEGEMGFQGNLSTDLDETGLFIGTANHYTTNNNHKFYCEMEIDFFNIILNSNNIDDAKDSYQSKTFDLITKTYYNKLLCHYNFKRINNLGIVYDESKNTNFLERTIIYK